MKHLKTFNELTESSSAGSQNSNDTMPFKYSKSYDYRIGYSKNEFIVDLNDIMEELSKEDQKDLLLLIKGLTGFTTIEELEKINSRDLDTVIKEVENFLNSKSDFEIKQYPDGYYLIFEDVKDDNGLNDIYYHPIKKSIKIVQQNGNAAENEIIVELSKFRPINFGIENEDFLATINQVDSIRQKDTSYKNPL